MNTFVVSTDSKGEIEYKNNNKILYCSIIIPILILSITTCLNIRAKDTVLGDYLKIIDIIQEDIPVHQTTISKNFSVVKTSKETIHNDYVVLSTYKNNKSDDDKEIAVKIAQKVFDSDFIIDENEIFSIEINSGFNIGIASKNKNQRFNGTVEHWKYEIEQLEK